jgi:hypothetical protein
LTDRNVVNAGDLAATHCTRGLVRCP